MTLGLKRAGFNVVAAIEIDRLAASVYELNHSSVKLKRQDIRRVSAKGLRRELKLRPGQLDLLAGCPPCQGFSTLRTRNGRRQNRDARNDLVSEMLRFAKAFLPKVLMMENVPRLEGRKPFRDLCDGLKKIGYEVAWETQDAADYGVPQRRKRLILLANRSRKVPPARKATRIATVRHAIGALPKAGDSKDFLHDLPEKRGSRIRRFIRDIPLDGGSREDLSTKRQLPCHRKTDGFKDTYGRMSWDDVAPTITGGCFNPSKGRFLHPAEHRNITMREAALLQSFPKKYRFVNDCGKQAAALMIGNALPPEFIRRHGLAIRRAVRRIAPTAKGLMRGPKRRRG